MEATKHSKIGASSYHRWRECPGSVKACENIPQRTSSYAEEGTEAHDHAANILLGKQPTKPCDTETYEAIKVYTEFVHSLLKSAPNHILRVEEKFDLSKIYPGLFGTADCVVYDIDNKKLWVIDYKHGAGIPVEVRENEQLRYYALGALISLNLPCEEIHTVIVQPRCYHPDGPIRIEVFKSVEMISFAADLSENAARCFIDNAPLVSGDHCRFCPAAPTCPEIHKKALEVTKTEFSSIAPYDPEVLSKTLNWLPAIEAWVKNVREFAYNEAKHGRVPPGFKLVAKRSTRRWKDEKAAYKFMCENFPAICPDDFLTKPEIKSVAQMEKLISSKDKKRLDAVVISESSGDALVEASDPRPSLALLPQQEFTKIESA